MSGYASRGNPILGLSANEGHLALAEDGKPYTTLGYMNGPGAVPANAPRPDLTNVDTQSLSFHQQALYPTSSETHGGEDVPVYAWGPGEEAIAGTMEENAIFHAMARALGFEWRQ
jgi:alkaline phosphatase